MIVMIVAPITTTTTTTTTTTAAAAATVGPVHVSLVSSPWPRILYIY